VNNFHFQKGKAGIYIMFIIIIVLILGGFLWFYLHNSTKQQNISQETNQPAIKVTDYSQGVPQNQKTVVLIQHSDSSYEKIILSNTAADNFVKKLPEDDKLVSKTPLK
jgi:hypothetical protein